MMTMNGPATEYPLLIRESHLDTFGHVNNATYLTIFEDARWEMISTRGYGLEKIRQTGHGPVILEVKLKFIKELRLRERIQVKSRLLAYKGKVFVLRQWMENDGGVVCADAEFTGALFDLKARKIVAPTPEWRSALGLTAAAHQ